MAALWHLPVVYVMENNQYGEYTAADKAMAGSGTGRAEAMGIPAVRVDGNDILAVYHAAAQAVARARLMDGPSFIECVTYRIRGHHMGDQGDTYGYRKQEEIEEWREKDPIRRFRDYLLSAGIVDLPSLQRVDHEVSLRIAEAIEYAQQSPYPDASEVVQEVYG